MNPKNLADLFFILAQSTQPSQIEQLLRSIGDTPELRIEEKFGFADFQWRFYGERDSNMSTINLAAKPGRSLVERITNAIDAILEKEMLSRGGTPPNSPMEAAKLWFGRPMSTNDSGIFSWKDFGSYDHDKHVSVILLPGDDENLPSIDIKDNGVGLAPNNFSKTILSLQRGNKLTKKYLAGAFGQGGSSTLAFSKYTFIASKKENSDELGFTIIRKISLPEEYGEDAYVYLAISDDTTPTVPYIKIERRMDLYPQIEEKLHDKIRYLDFGTLVRHIGYRTEGFNNKLGPTSGNLYHLLNYLMFDPILPFRVLDFRDIKNLRNELITGSRNRLMSLIGEKLPEGETGTEIKIFAPREMISPLSDNHPCIGLEYWIAFNWRKTNDKISIRNKSNAVYIDENHPILGTLNGQNQGEQTGKIFKDLGLPMISKHAIVHIDASRATKEVRTNLFSSTREGFKDEQALKEILTVLKNMIQEDGELYKLETQLLEKLLENETKETDADVKREITSLLIDAGFEGSVEGEAPVEGVGGLQSQNLRSKSSKPRATLIPINTLPWPEVTYLNVVYPLPNLEIPQSINRVIRIETDANYRFDKEMRITIRFEPDIIEVMSTSFLEGGRKHWRVKTKPDSTINTEGQVFITLTKINGEQIVSILPFCIHAQPSAPSKFNKGLIPPFDIRAVSPDEERFGQLWENLEPEKIEEVAYRYIRTASNGISVFYNTQFGPFRKQLEKLEKNVSLLGLFKKNYEIWIGYHSILQERAVNEFNDDINFDKIQEKERSIVAEMEVKQAIRFATLQQEKIKNKEAAL